MQTIRKSEDRGHANHGWLDSFHTFSFADYYDAGQMGFRALRVINEDRVAPGMGFGEHPHRDMEIITYVVSGALRHQDSMGNTAVMRAGEVQRITAGTGITHSEFNDSHAEPVHLLQIWLLPAQRGVTPSYAEKSFAAVEPGRLHLITSGSGRDGSIAINQDADLFVAKLGPGENIGHRLAPGRAAWLQLIEGELDIDGAHLRAGDAAAFAEIEALSLHASAPAHLLLFDLA